MKVAVTMVIKNLVLRVFSLLLLALPDTTLGTSLSNTNLMGRE